MSTSDSSSSSNADESTPSSVDAASGVTEHDRERQTTLTSGHTITFPEWFVFLNGCTPLIMLALDARAHRLGPDPIDNALHTSGLLAICGLLATLAITPLRKIAGFNGLHAYRRPLGLLSFLYAFMHAGIYVAHDRAGDVADAWNEITQRRYLQIGSASLVILFLLTATSTPRMIRLLGFRVWKILHRWVYVAAILGVVHQYMQTRAGTTRPIVMGIVLSGLLGYRLYDRLRTKRSPIDQASTAGKETARQKASMVKTSGHQASALSNASFRVTCVGEATAAMAQGDQSILDAADSAGIELPADCRAGVCGTCRVRLVCGQVEMDNTDGLSKSDAENSIILACQATCQSDVKIALLD